MHCNFLTLNLEKRVFPTKINKRKLCVKYLLMETAYMYAYIPHKYIEPPY